MAQSLTTGNRKVLVEGGADARFVAPGHLVYLRRGTLMAVPFDPQRLEVTTGAAVGVVADVMQAANILPVQIDTGAGQFAVSESGSLVYVTGGVFPQARWSLVWVDRTGRSEALLGRPGRVPRTAALTRRQACGVPLDDGGLGPVDLRRPSWNCLSSADGRRAKRPSLDAGRIAPGVLLPREGNLQRAVD